MSRLRPSRRHPLHSHPSRPPLSRLRRQRLWQHRLRQHLRQRIQSCRHRHLRQHPVRPPRLTVSPPSRLELRGNRRLLRQARPLLVPPRLSATVWRPPRKRRPRLRWLTTLPRPFRPQWRKSLRPRRRRLYRRRRHLRPYPRQSNQHQHQWQRLPRPYPAHRRTDFGTRLSPVTSRQCEGLSPATAT